MAESPISSESSGGLFPRPAGQADNGTTISEDMVETIIGRPDSLITGPNRAPAASAPEGNDVLSDVLHAFRVARAASLRVELATPLAVDFPSTLAPLVCPGIMQCSVLHIVAQGSCWIEAQAMARRQLPTGSIVWLLRGQAHRMGVGDAQEPISASEFVPAPPWGQLGVLRSRGGRGEHTRLVCVFLRSDGIVFNPILGGLPPLLVVRKDAERDGDWIHINADRIVQEATVTRVGGACLFARLTELLCVEILRRHLTATEDGQTGCLAALADRHVAAALACFHTHPGREWSLQEVAARAGVSRTALIDRFRRVLAVPPMRYLTRWRLQLAAEALCSSQKSAAQIAEEVGYGSDVAFSRAFKRETGIAPAAWRRSHRESTITVPGPARKQ